MKKLISILLACSLTASIFPVNVMADSLDVTNDRLAIENRVTEDNISESIMKMGLYEDEKVQEYNSFSDGVSAQHDLMVNNTSENKKLTESEWYVDNCVIVGTEQDIVFDTSNVISAVRYSDTYYIQYETVRDAEEAVDVFETYPTVEYAETDSLAYIEFESEPVDKLYSSQDANGYKHYSWGVSSMGLDTFADYVSKKSSGRVTVAVIDSGVDTSHPFLQGRLLSNGYNYYDDNQNVNDEFGQGTHVAGIIADSTQGLNVDILPIKVIGSTWETPWSLITKGVEHATNEGVDIINLSIWGSTINESHQELDAKITAALNAGITIITCAGDFCGNTADYCPSHRSDVIVTAAIDSENDNYYEIIAHRQYGSNSGSTVDITAPGENILGCIPYDEKLASTEEGFGLSSGTALAAAHVSAAAAMLKLRYPSAFSGEIESMLKLCAVDLGTAGNDTVYGAGKPVLNTYITDLPFYDIMATDWYYVGIRETYSRGYMTGKTQVYFVPMENMKRHDMAIVFYRMAGAPPVIYRDIYTDVTSDAYYANAAVWAYDNGIITGWSNGQMGVNTDVIRQDFAIMLYRYANKLGLDVSDTANISGYTDYAYVSDYAQTAVSWAVGTGLMGQGVTELKPLSNASRADIAVMIYRFIQAYNL